MASGGGECDVTSSDWMPSRELFEMDKECTKQVNGSSRQHVRSSASFCLGHSARVLSFVPFLTMSAVFSIFLRHTVASTEFLKTTIILARSTRRRIRVVRRERRMIELAVSFWAPTDKREEVKGVERVKTRCSDLPLPAACLLLCAVRVCGVCVRVSD